MNSPALKVCLLACLATVTPGMASAAGFDQYLGFGDSTLDSGHFRYHTIGNAALDDAIAYTVAHSGATGAFVGNGVMNSVLLSGMFGLTAVPSDNGGTNYAIGNAESTVTSGVFTSTIQQIQEYLSAVNGVADSNALYVIATGSNDLHDANASTAGWLDTQATTLAAQVAALQAAGARTIMVTNPYNSAIYSGLGGEITSANADAYATSVAYSNRIWADLTAAGVNFIPVDEDSVFKYVVKNPTLFGFTASSVLTSSSACYTTTSLVCAPLSQEYLNSYLFVDDHHMTTAGQTIVADLEYSLLIAPSEISLVAESAVQSGLSRLSTIQGQIDLSGQNRGPNGINAWMSAGANNVSLRNSPMFPTASGAPYGSTVGVDYQLPNKLVLGAAVSAGGQTQQFSTIGHFSEVDEALSFYTAYKEGLFWGDAVASFGLVQDSVARPVKLGIFTDNNSGDTTGTSMSVALRGGSDFNIDRVTTGPVVGLVMQRVGLDGYTEAGTSGVTALSFGSQTRDSLVSQMGWRGSVSLGDWQPFAEMAWNHDWAGSDRQVATSLTSAAVAPYLSDAAPVASDWGTASLGVSYKVTPDVTLKGTTSTVFVNPQVFSYGGEMGVSVSF